MKNLACLLLSALCMLSMQARSQLVSASNPKGSSTVITIQAPIRLSQWLLDQSVNVPPLGLQWQVPQERPAQEHLKQQILGWLADPQDKHHPTLTVAARDRLALLLRGMPVTGRVVLGTADASWLLVHPAQDPVLEPGQTLVLPARPRAVSVLLSSGQVCHLPHTAGADTRSYVQFCMAQQPVQDAAQQVDVAWLIQPDGNARSVGVARWNEHPQDLVAPGAWIWAPDRKVKTSEAFNQGLAKFLATQGPSLHAPSVTALNAQGAPLIERATPKHDLDITASNWGTVGLIQTPTARMRSAGSVSVNYTRAWPYLNQNFMLQPMDWMEFGFRYTHILSVPLTQNETYLDKSLDIKLRLAKESRYTPELAVGLRDIGGTGLFSSEYLVGNKRYGDLDFSLGMGWGYLGGRGDVANPLSVFSSKYQTRPTGTGGAYGGEISGNAMFTGATSLFGGVQWRTPWANSLLKVEVDGNNYSHDPLSQTYDQKSPINLAWLQRLSPYVDMQLSFERGTQLGVGFTIHGNLADLSAPKLGDPALPRFNPLPPDASGQQTAPVAWGQTALDVARLTDWQVQTIRQEGATLTLAATRSTALHTQERIERAVAVLHRDAPSSVKRFVLLLGEYGLAVSAQEVDRAAWVAEHDRAQAPSLKKPAIVDASPRKQDASAFNPQRVTANAGRRETLWANAASPWYLTLDPTYNQIVGGVDGFVFFKLGVQANAQYSFTPNTWVDGGLNVRLLDNYDNFKLTKNSALPPVRTFQREYATASTVTVPNTQLTHVGQLNDQQFYSLYGGMLEPMFAGVGGEWLWRPNRSRVAVGVDVNRVQQRAFEQDFRLRDFAGNTGHVTLYWDTGIQNLMANVSVGQYLAGDQGVTVGVSRRFDNGVSMGVYATKTNVSAEQFGEGSFDKGLFVNIPFDVLLPTSSTSTANLAWSPMTRDGGAKLNRLYTLYGLTAGRDRRATQFAPPRGNTLQAGDDAFSLPASEGDLTLGDLGSDISRSATGLGRGLFDASTAPQWLGAAGLVLLASGLDNSADTWSKNNQGEGATQLAKTLDNLPLLLGAGASALALGLADDDLARTGYTAVKAAGFTLLGNVALKTAVGRARPLDEQGSGSFNGFSNTAPQSSFASNHVATTMALVTPFAQQYQQPWLYSLGALSALGRVQQREHWLSDTAAAGVLGYAVGSVMLDQQRQGPQLSLVGNRVQATWRY